MLPCFIPVPQADCIPIVASMFPYFIPVQEEDFIPTVARMFPFFSHPQWEAIIILVVSLVLHQLAMNIMVAMLKIAVWVLLLLFGISSHVLRQFSVYAAIKFRNIMEATLNYLISEIPEIMDTDEAAVNHLMAEILDIRDADRAALYNFVQMIRDTAKAAYNFLFSPDTSIRNPTTRSSTIDNMSQGQEMEVQLTNGGEGATNQSMNGGDFRTVQ
jgi:hypothetical protein